MVLLGSLIDDLCQRFLSGLKEAAPYYLLAIALVLFLCLPAIRNTLIRYRKSVRICILVTASVLAVIWGWSLLWASDDAYITFRYAENLVRGHGLVLTQVSESKVIRIFCGR